VSSGILPATAMAEQSAMRHALELAATGLGATYPNPAVGCVVLSPSGEIVGAARTADSGRPHAEALALGIAGENARGGTVVVTLEPCAHSNGRGAPCVGAILTAGVERVVVALSDPNPVATGGLDRLRAAGVDVQIGVLAEQSRHLLRPWLHGIRSGRPFVTWKFAATLDGRIAARDGTSRWVTGEPARLDVHRLRSTVDTIVVGVGTVLADDPALTTRGEGGAVLPRQPLRVVMDSTGRTPLGARVRDSTAPTRIVTAADHPGGDGRVDVRATLHGLYAEGRRHVLLEGGATLAGAFVAAGVVDEVVAYLAPALLGAGPAALDGAGISTISEALRLTTTDVSLVGDDVRITAVPTAAQEA
jgi:diaminohydroxyphosphoribosylaminopyrimidine deaminase/5-amino-6-(5-phosphoribosylamino)uracil reductase